MLSLPGQLVHLPSYEQSLWTITAASELLAKVGPVRPAQQDCVVFGDEEYPLVLYRAVRASHERLTRSRGAIACEDEPPDPLGDFVLALRERLKGGAQEHRERQMLIPSKTRDVAG